MLSTTKSKLHQKRHWQQLFTLCVFGILFILVACNPLTPTVEPINSTIAIDGKSIEVKVPAGSTVASAIRIANVTLNNLDSVDPPLQTTLTDGMLITVKRIREEFINEDQVIAFQRQTVKNESLPEGQTLLIQAGVNGQQQITYRILYEDDQEKSRTVFKTTTIIEAVPEIVMVGVQTPYTVLPIGGTLAYLTSGNAWVMEDTTGNRRPVVTSGDLDGRVFSLSKDGEWLLYTRSTSKDAADDINSLWMVNIKQSDAKPVDLRVKNIIHFADWVPGSGLTISYSTVEPRTIAPGWQANNDLFILKVSAAGGVLSNEKVLEANSGGIYGWWGTGFSWSKDGSLLAYSRPDSIGLLDFEKKELVQLQEIIPYKTNADWAWSPGISWSPDSNILYTTLHTPKASIADNEASPLFDLGSYIVASNQSISLVPQTGMFVYPSVSPFQDGKRFSVAFLQSIFPEQSETSRYKLMVMDRDGSNIRQVFPPEGSQGLDPQHVVWESKPTEDAPRLIACVYMGNLWLVNSITSQAQQITGDGSISRLDWK